MKKLIAFTLFFGLFSTLTAQDFSGDWNGALDIQGQTLPLIFKITRTETGYSTLLNSPKQSPIDMPVAETVVEDDTIKLSAPNIGLTYSGVLKDNIIEGTFKQGALEAPMNFTKSDSTATEKKTAN